MREAAQPGRFGLRERAAPAATAGSPRPALPRLLRIASTARTSGSGFITMPGPPPYGTSSTLRCRSVVWSRRSCTSTSSARAAIPRLTTPSASAASTIRGKIVTMSNFTVDRAASKNSSLLELCAAAFPRSDPATLRRINPDFPVRHVDLDADVDGQRNQDLAPRSVSPPAGSRRRRLRPSRPRRRRRLGRLHRAPDELMLVVRARLQRLQRLFGHPQLEAGKPFHVLDRARSLRSRRPAGRSAPATSDRQLLVARRPNASRTWRPRQIALRQNRSRD